MHFKIKKTFMSRLCSLCETNDFVRIHILTNIFENLKVITLSSAVTRSKLETKCVSNMVYSGKERQKNVYPSWKIVRPTSQQTPLPKFVIWSMTC